MSLARLSFHTLRFVLAILCASLVILAYLNYAFQDRPYMALTLALGSAVGYWFTLARRLSGEGAGFGIQRAVRVLVQAFASLLAASGIAVALSMDPASGLCLLAVGACVFFVAAHFGDSEGTSHTSSMHHQGARGNALADMYCDGRQAIFGDYLHNTSGLCPGSSYLDPTLDPSSPMYLHHLGDP